MEIPNDYMIAEINDEESKKIAALEKTLKSEDNSDIVLIAFQSSKD